MAYGFVLVEELKQFRNFRAEGGGKNKGVFGGGKAAAVLPQR